MVTISVHDPGPPNLNVAGTLGVPIPGGGRLDGINFALFHADGAFNIEIGGRGGQLLDWPFRFAVIVVIS